MSEKGDSFKQNNCNGGPDHVANKQNSTESGQPNNQTAKNVRYIPITLDYDDKTTVNTDSSKPTTEQPTTNATNTKPSQRYQPPNDPPKPTSIFDRVKHFPVNLRATHRNESPGRTIPITIQSDGAKGSPAEPAAKHSANPNAHDEVDHSTATPSDDKINADTNAINKIQKIQMEITALMDQVENFKGTRKDKDYMYLDEMLTQNLLKLDTIDTDGKDKIKQARREAINCINKCISVLEAKSEETLGRQQSQSDTRN